MSSPLHSWIASGTRTLAMMGCIYFGKVASNSPDFGVNITTDVKNAPSLLEVRQA
jgi:hypothetical protein